MSLGARQSSLGVSQTLEHVIRTPYQVGAESSDAMSRIVDARSFATAPDWPTNTPLHDNARATNKHWGFAAQL